MAAGDEQANQQSSEEMAQNQNLLLDSGGSTFDPNLPGPPRIVRDSGSGLTPGGTISYTGPFRVTASNTFEYGPDGKPLGQYNEVQDPKDLLFLMKPTDRKEFLKKVSVALGGTYKPSKSGILDSDFTAVGYAMRIANSMRRTVDVAINAMIEDGGGYLDREGGGGGRTYTVSSPDDLKPLANELALQIYGRVLDPKSMNRIIRAVQQEEASSQASAAGGGTVERAGSPQNIITQELVDANPEEAMVSGTASIVEMVRRSLGTA